MSKSAPSRMKKDDLVAELLEYGYTHDDLMKMKRRRLAQLVSENRQGRVAADAMATATASEEPDDTGPTAKGESNMALEPAADGNVGDGPELPEMTAPGWAQYVLGQFADDELDEQNPRVEGLRRVAELLLGEIVEEECDLIQCPDPANGMRASVKARITFLKDGLTKAFTGLADAGPDNCTDEFGRFPVAMAETRAKGRAFRAALRLRRVVAAEEVAGMPLDGESLDEQAVQVGQVNIISMLAERQKVAIPALLKHLGIEKGNVKKLTRAEGLLVAKTLNEMRESGEVPEGLRRKD